MWGVFTCVMACMWGAEENSGGVFLLAPVGGCSGANSGCHIFAKNWIFFIISFIFLLDYSNWPFFVLLCLKIKLYYNTHQTNHPNHLKYTDQYCYAGIVV